MPRFFSHRFFSHRFFSHRFFSHRVEGDLAGGNVTMWIMLWVCCYD
jgi:hypothetical protein